MTPKMLNYSSALNIAKEAKKINCTIILGGVHVSAIPKIIMQKRADIVDYVVAGYGEIPFVEIIQGELGVKNKKPKVIYHPRPDFNILPLPQRSSFIDLSQYVKRFKNQHPAWDKYSATNIFTQQGCKNKCLFCSRQTPGKGKVYYRNPKSIWEEVLNLSKVHGIDCLVVFDDQITQDTKWLEQLIKLKPKNIPRIVWYVFSNAENISEKLLILLKQLPVIHMFVGMETGDSKLAKKIGKGKNFSPQICLRAVKLISNFGIGLTPSFILGLPGETEKTLQKTLIFAKSIKSIANFQESFVACLIPFPGSIAFQKLISIYPEYLNEDEFDGEELSKKWFKYFCHVPYDVARNYSKKILELSNYRITTDKGGYPSK